MKLWSTAGIAAVLSLCCAGGASAALHAGDKVAISVYNHPELATQALVDSRGDVSMNLIGAVSAAGADEKTLAARIQDHLKAYMSYPAVDVVLLSQDQTIFVKGAPGGTLTYRPGDTLSSAVSDIQKQCTCLLSQTAADLQDARILRDGKVLGPFDLNASQGGDTQVQPGDTIAFENKPIAITVRGSVKSPGTAYLGTNEPLSNAIAQAGGFDTAAAYGMIVLDRDGQRLQIAQGSPEFNEPAHAGDSLLVPSVEHIQVIGAVNQGGDVSLKQDFTLLSALYYAGGPNKWANLRDVVVMHRGVKTSFDITRMEHGDLSSNPALEDGDVVYVPEGHKIDWRGFFQNLLLTRFLFPRIP